jgi:hypothetical protein
MEILIKTNGLGKDTEVYFNGEKQDGLMAFEFNVNGNRSGKAKMVLLKHVDGRMLPLEYFGEGLRAFDEVKKVTPSPNQMLGGGKSSE